ncbi:MarR family transcriptional regulator [Paenibacillus pasadenensis]|uniref:MarR family winged helix-turn-helix transcriptional regulator n=1 Tax=Paenibacillus pasadenensis TaxID=217090 RepID=UPI00203C8937|nr:MarR family transcriptional regulator [Paenibacillus pasadenensis]MCM3748419.1 MarR family transcriptional regulator [Paenibacillus pasadenensis]
MAAEAQRFHAAVQALIQSLELSMQDVLKECGMTRTQLFVLHFVKLHGPCKLALIAEKMDVKPSAVTVMMDRLEKSGYVRRRHDTVDRRAIFVEITEVGEHVMKEFRRHREKQMGGLLSRLSPEEMGTITNLMEKLAASEIN